MKIYSYLILIFCLLGVTFQVQASHIVGGEFELVHLYNNHYRLSLILYSDDINIMDPAAIDPTATVHIWRKSDDGFVRSITLPKFRHTSVPYTNPSCAIPNLKTSKVVYSAEIVLESSVFTSEEGYYINYERCCRNGVINNIQNPGETGQAFYLEFPPVAKDGVPFINSSPNLFPPLSDFARLGYPFYFDFRGTDADGDSLVYSLVTPLAGSSSPDPGNVLPPPRPAPYQTVDWNPGYSLNNMIPGNPALRINQQGFIQVTPSETGLFVFSVLAEEYRNGKKIGEVRRDFQMLVYDYEGNDFPPDLSAQKPSNGLFYEDEIRLTDADFTDFENNRCLVLQVSDDDVDAEAAPQNGKEPLKFKVIPVNFSGNVTNEYLSVTHGSVDKDNRNFYLDLCLPLCPPLNDRPYVFDVVAYDNACALPLTDTLRVVVDLSLGTRNQMPETRTTLNNNQVDVINLYKTLGETIEFDVRGQDPDNDRIALRAVGDGFSLADYGMEFSNQQGQGPLQSTFRWPSSCENVNLLAKNLYTVFFITEDEDICQQANADTVAVNIALTAPPNEAPTIEILDLNTLSLEADMDTSMVFEIRGYDINTQDIIKLRLDSIASANTTALSYQWQDAEGSREVQSTLSLFPDCAILENGEMENAYVFHFSVEDNPCYNEKNNTLSLSVTFRDKVVSFSDINFPNVFTPNGDGKNDVFEIPGLPSNMCYDHFENIKVVNRWGKVLFESNSLDFKWDGENYPAGTYYYQLQYTQRMFRSSLTLIRGLPGASSD